tara:strand:- start:51 stop:389 length:339 start_codon:yes stop_codon:yes gene_type:complete
MSRTHLDNFEPTRLFEKLVPQIEAIEDALVEAMEQKRISSTICGTTRRYDPKHKVQIPSIWEVNRAFNAKVDMLDVDYQQLTEMVYGKAYSLKGEEEQTEAYNIAAKFVGKK